MSYLYLLQTRESIKLNEPIYKIGRTKREGLKRFEQYPAGSNLILHVECTNSKEKEKIIKALFKEHFKQITEYGQEYFMGDVNLMKLHMSLVANVYDISSGYSGISKLFGFIGQHVIDVTKKFPSPHMVLDGPDDDSDDGPDEVELPQPKSKIAEILNGVPSELVDVPVDELVDVPVDELVDEQVDVPVKSDNKNLRDNNNKKTNTIKYKCEECNKNYESKMGLWHHNKKFHIEPAHKIKLSKTCSYCDKELSCKQSKWRHEKTCKTNKKVSLEEKIDDLNKKFAGLQKAEPKIIQKNKIICL